MGDGPHGVDSRIVSINAYQLPDNASSIDRLTLGVMKWWFGGGRIGAAYVSIVIVLLTSVVGFLRDFSPTLAVAAIAGGWHVGRKAGARRREPYRPRSVFVGAVLGVLLFPFLGVLVFFALLPFRILMLSIGPVLQAIVISGVFAVAYVNGRRRRQFAEGGVYPRPMRDGATSQ